MHFLPRSLTAILVTVASVSAYNTTIFKSYSPAFKHILGSNPSITSLARSAQPLFHEAAVYHAPTKALWITSDFINHANNNSTEPVVLRATGLLTADDTHVERVDTGIRYPSSGYRFPPNTVYGDVLVYTGQGNTYGLEGGIFFLNPYPPYNSTNALSSYGDYPFNSPNDIAVTSDGTMYFTDPVYGFENGGNILPWLPNQVYSFNPFEDDVRVVADGFGRPNGIALDKGSHHVYISDTGADIGNGTLDKQGPRTIYAYKLQESFLGDRHVFAMPKQAGTAPDGMKVDTKGNVYGGIGSGVTVWNSDGKLLGEIDVGASNSVGNIGFGEAGVLFVMGGDTLWRIDLSRDIIGVGV